MNSQKKENKKKEKSTLTDDLWWDKLVVLSYCLEEKKNIPRGGFEPPT